LSAGRRHLAAATLLAVAILTFGPRNLTLVPGAIQALVPGPQVALAASPEPSAAGGDTRSPGEGPGLVGAPFLAVAGVVALGLLAAGATLLYLRLTNGSGKARSVPGKGRGDRPR
jgi:hypothetical protein